ncbi:MAG: error-prone DNA polymerase [Myxococcales bacterium]|nr:error-prone DNA polymerase [Myxococcales bacterium]
MTSSLYAELHCRSNFSFLRGASHPRELVAQAAELGLETLALVDLSGFYGVVHAWEARGDIAEALDKQQLTIVDPREIPREARRVADARNWPGATLPPELSGAHREERDERDDDVSEGDGFVLSSVRCLPRLLYGSELEIRSERAESAMARARRMARPAGEREAPPPDDALVMLARDRDGYALISQLVSRGRLRVEKGGIELYRDELLELAAGSGGEGVIVLAGGPRSRLLRRLRDGDEAGARRELGELREVFGDALYVELTRHLRPGDVERSLALRALADASGVEAIASNDVFFHTRERKMLHDVLTCIREGLTLREAGRALLPNAERALKTGREMLALFRDMPDVVHRTVEAASRVTFTLDELSYCYPAEAVPPGHSADSFLAELARRGLEQRLGRRRARDLLPQLRRELAIIGELRYAGYFLTMWEVVQYCRQHGILCQGRGSAANSLVCFSTGITSVSPDQIDMLFERFLSVERKEPPDIDLDIEHDRREEVLQYVYKKYGRDRAAMVATVIRYRARSAIRDVGKTLGLSEQTVLRISKFTTHGWEKPEDGSPDPHERAALAAGLDPKGRTWRQLVGLAAELQSFPRHLSIHTGGFMLSSRPVADIVPVENGRMPDRTVIQWDKDDIDSLKIFKVDLLGLGMLNVIARAFRLIKAHRGVELELHSVPQDDRATYEMIQRADTLGVFQIESRAQMGMLPRLKPACFYDLVIEVALVRPGPIQGGMVHPYLRRRRGEERVDYPHPKLRPILERTLGVPIFQEQVMKMAIEVGGYSPGEADQLRRDMAAWRRSGKMERHQARLFRKMCESGIDEEFAERIVRQIEGFGSYGFPESHAAAFAHLVYVSAYIKCHYAPEFAAALCNAQPMGFYHVSSIVADAHRHGIPIRPVCVQRSEYEATLEEVDEHLPPPPADSARYKRRTLALRMGLRSVRGLNEAAARAVVAERQRGGPFASIADLARRCAVVRGDDDEAKPLRRRDVAQLAYAGAFGALVERRGAIWQAVALGGSDLVANVLDEKPMHFDPLPRSERVRMDYWYSESFLEDHPMKLYRSRLRGRGVTRSLELKRVPPGRLVKVAGVVIVRQRPSGPGGVVFMALEDETGLVDIVLRPEIFERNRVLICMAEMLLIEGQLQADGDARSVMAHRLETLAREGDGAYGVRSHDFH